jgi:hypothetical protein
MVFVLIAFYWFFFGELYALIKGAFGVYHLADLIERKHAFRYGLRVCIWALLGAFPAFALSAYLGEVVFWEFLFLVPLSMGVFISWRGRKSKTR